MICSLETWFWIAHFMLKFRIGFLCVCSHSWTVFSLSNICSARLGNGAIRRQSIQTHRAFVSHLSHSAAMRAVVRFLIKHPRFTCLGNVCITHLLMLSGLTLLSNPKNSIYLLLVPWLSSEPSCLCLGFCWVSFESVRQAQTRPALTSGVRAACLPTSPSRFMTSSPISAHGSSGFLMRFF